MDSVSLQQFLQMRASAATRMQAQSPATTGKANPSAANWQNVLEAKRRELGVTSAPTTTTFSTASQSLQSTSPSDYQARAQELKTQMAQGMPVRRVGNLLDVRA